MPLIFRGGNCRELRPKTCLKNDDIVMFLDKDMRLALDQKFYSVFKLIEDTKSDNAKKIASTVFDVIKYVGIKEDKMVGVVKCNG